MDYKEIIKNRLDELPPQWKLFVTSENWRVVTLRLCTQFGLSEEQSAHLENEIFFVILGMEPPKDFSENIKSELGLDENTARRIADSVNGSVFSRVMSDLKEYWNQIDKTEVKQERQSNVGSDFEQTILNQARAMQLAKPADSGVTSSEIRGTIDQTPPNLPIEPVVEHKIHDYTSTDPYREPVE